MVPLSADYWEVERLMGPSLGGLVAQGSLPLPWIIPFVAIAAGSCRALYWFAALQFQEYTASEGPTEINVQMNGMHPFSPL